ncbi:MAG TPA: OmpA family protein [Bosea sp. (in: a-proteobacteria)]|jgi:outer membrane protein OmpA-like peptidoglycan-associated protein|uniref:OmpA family protein n=1 Tax=Bosea sp. (in: a-proteobacteria) TaxID=1871050 RepID=UPI002E14C3C0|nr:OmpA family protein [Bosea sp. (in: a-proteobacteria)]
MARQAGWLWGFVPLAVLWSSANLIQADAVRRDVEGRALAAGALAGAAPGIREVTVKVDGRDVYLDGEATSADGAARALAQLGSEFGVRRVIGGLTQVVAQKPYSWSASRDAKRVTLAGHVPDEATAKANIAAARALGSGLQIDDQQKIAFGAPTGFAALTATMIADLGRLSAGKVALDDARYCVEGTASSPEAYLALRAAAATAAPTGFTRVDCALNPPTVAPYVWTAEKNAAGAVTVSGYYPSDAVKRELASLLARAFPGGGMITDRSLPAAGEPPAFLTQIGRAISELARLHSGKVEIEGPRYRIGGEGPKDFASCEALRLNIAQADGPESVAVATITCPPPPPPPPAPAMPPMPEAPTLNLTFAPPPAAAVEPPAPRAPAAPTVATAPPPPAPPPAAVVPARPLQWRAEKSATGITLSGFAPDAAAKAAAAELARGALNGGTLSDQTSIEPNLRNAADYGAVTRFALGLLSKIERGSVNLAGGNLSVAGAASDHAGWTALQEALKGQALPAGLALSGVPALTINRYGFSATVDKTGGTLTGHLPDAGSKQAISALIEASPLHGKIQDETTIVPAAPAGFGVAARSAVQDLLRLDLGSVSVVDHEVSVQGLTCRDLIRAEIETNAAGGLPEGFTGKAEVGLRQTGCVIDPPSTCQNDLDALTQRYYVMFGQGTAVVTLDPITERAMTEAAAILKQCPASRVTVEGHANLDGERAGFNNLDLSRRRALRVREELVRRGLEPDQLEVKGYGVERPLVAHGDTEAKVKNRRVQFTVAK